MRVLDETYNLGGIEALCLLLLDYRHTQSKKDVSIKSWVLVKVFIKVSEGRFQNEGNVKLRAHEKRCCLGVSGGLL